MYVLQPWVAGVGCKMQSILLSGLRAPDQKTDNVKKLVRWMRSKCQVDADPQKQSYMQTIESVSDLIDGAMDELEYCTVHYAHHFADSFAVLAYHHPDLAVTMVARQIHNLVATELFHFVPETEDQFLYRHRDKMAAL